mmetsp:Transcript_16565/g.20629  ORF Transcript_16565/g.20629 Transcript_16565/m.20629 type:complete len:273 (+) Transcript_16565:73-891(+)|eukprot:CAMPEP_0172497576 /NCGR_PEP_ID=MMETSP1066-20121228/101737_1 /TAXON_ID=671091 /ORGANISM="Coscinodiscus wailesii, Strain CCMP2513" /LENGTH=272 /DNA_ID=CAMNT_0013270433 /DNA_START=58 /DNA_END=876 /DNA_ORIENTATION=-
MAESMGDGGQNEDWTDEEIESFLLGFVILIIVAAISFFFYSRQQRPNHAERDRLIQQQHQLQRELHILRQRRGQEDERERSGIENITGDQKQVVDGIVPFRHGSAAKWSPSEADKKSWKQRQNLTIQSLFQNDGNISPPPRGCNLVVSVRESEWVDGSAAQVLTMVGATYNLFVILDIPHDESEPGVMVKKARDALRKCGLPEDVVPEHRIVASQSTAGRIAFIRQLRPEIVFDYDEELKKQLTRFGFRVGISRRENGDSLGVFLATAKQGE